MNIKSAVHHVLSENNLKSREDLDIWCGKDGRLKIYSLVEGLASKDWNRINNPKASVRYYYQKKLTGYKISL